jgi:hypothetical protein
MTVVQDPVAAEVPIMPQSALRACGSSLIADSAAIAELLAAL